MAYRQLSKSVSMVGRSCLILDENLSFPDPHRLKRIFESLGVSRPVPKGW